MFAVGRKALGKVVEARPDVFNHNLRLSPVLYRGTAWRAVFPFRLRLLQRVKELDPSMFTQIGIMAGLGEGRSVGICKVMEDMRAQDIDSWTIDISAATPKPPHRVDRFVTPRNLAAYEKAAYARFLGCFGHASDAVQANHAGERLCPPESSAQQKAAGMHEPY